MFMGGDNSDLKVSKETLDEIAGGLRSAMGELKEVGAGTGELQGAGFSKLSMTKLEVGGNSLAEAFDGFCDQWEWGVRGLIENASGLARDLGLAAGTFWEEEQYIKGTFKVALNAVLPTGNPDASEAQIEHQGWGSILTPDGPDYSGKSFDQAAQNMDETWKKTGENLMTKGQGGLFTSVADSVGKKVLGEDGD